MANSKQTATLPVLDRARKAELIQRTLGIKHKLKVHESMKNPDNHEDLALNLLARWELEDELLAIEEVLSSLRRGNVDAKRHAIEKEGVTVQKKKPRD